MTLPSGHASIETIRQGIADFVVDHDGELPDIPAIAYFLEQRKRASAELASAKERGQRLVHAKQTYSPLERQVLDCKAAVAKAESDLETLYQPVGRSVFQAFLSGAIEELTIFSERLALHERIDGLQREYDALETSAESSMGQKVKAKAQRLLLAGKKKLAETKIGGLDRTLGQQILSSVLDETIRCDATAEVLDRVASSREFIDNCSARLRRAEEARAEAGQELSASLSLQHIESTRTLESEIELCKTTAREAASNLVSMVLPMTEALAQADPASLPRPLAIKLEELQSATLQQQAELSGMNDSEAGDSLLYPDEAFPRPSLVLVCWRCHAQALMASRCDGTVGTGTCSRWRWRLVLHAVLEGFYDFRLSDVRAGEFPHPISLHQDPGGRER